MGVVGKSARRKEGPEKLCGAARYIDDHQMPGCLFGATLRAKAAAGLIKRIVRDPAFDWGEFVVATAADVPGANYVQLIDKDQPLLADTEVRHPMEPILLVAHADRARAYEALDHFEVEYEAKDAVFDPETSPTTLKSFAIERGDAKAALRRADFVVEGEYHVPHQEHAYIETNGAMAWWEDDGTLVVLASMQCPFYVHKAMKPLFNLTDARLRVVQVATGGGFGGKEEYPNMIAGHAALLARVAKRPVKIIYDRHEDMAATTKRHPARVRHRTGVTRAGKIVAQDIDVLMDGGAYVTLSPVVLSRGTLHATGPYDCPNVRIRSRVVMTNSPPNGAFRGFGAPQTLFAAELHMEKIAAALGMDSVELRRRNVIRKGSTLAVGQVLRESVGAAAVLEACVKKSAYVRRARENARFNRGREARAWRGIGFALVHHGSGFTGSGEEYLASRAAVVLKASGSVHVLAASTEFGQGTNTMFAQLVADTLGIPYEWIVVEPPDTSRVPDSGPTVASRTCMIVGRIVQQAALQLKKRLEDEKGGVPRTQDAFARAALRLCGDLDELRFEAAYERPEGVTWDDASYTGDAYEAYSYMAAAVDVEVDRRTYELKVRRVWTAVDIGTVVNPRLAEGQVIGGFAQGLGYAVLEAPVYRNGLMQNTQLTNYIIPTAMDTPKMEVVFVPEPYSLGPFGAKGVGELPMDVPGPAVAAAVLHATGRMIAKLPVLPERIAAAVLGTDPPAPALRVVPRAPTTRRRAPRAARGPS